MFKESFVQKALELIVRRIAAHAGVGLWEIVGPVTKDLALFRGIVSSGSAFIFTELHIQNPMKLVFNRIPPSPKPLVVSATIALSFCLNH